MTKHFKPEEFRCKCGCGKDDIAVELVVLLEKARAIAKEPFIITSGCRCDNHNKNVGGVKNSSHIKGLAVDIAVTKTNQDKILSALSTYFSRIGIGKGFIHVDIDNTKPKNMWFYQ